MDQSHRIRTSAWAASACTRWLLRASAVEFPHLLGIGDRRSPCAASPRCADAAAFRAANSVTYPAPVGGILTDRLALARGHCSRPPSPSARSPLRAKDFAGKYLINTWLIFLFCLNLPPWTARIAGSPLVPGDRAGSVVPDSHDAAPSASPRSCPLAAHSSRTNSAARLAPPLVISQFRTLFATVQLYTSCLD